MAAYSGPPRPLASLTHTPPHSLLVQSYKPKEMQTALLNADGSGVAWYPPDGDPTPCRYRSPLPIWSDENLASLAPRIRAGLILAVVRSATPGLPVGNASTPPFVHGRLALIHNGYLASFTQRFMRPIREQLSDFAWSALAGGTDSEHLLALLVDSRESLPGAVRSLLQRVSEISRKTEAAAVMNLIVTDGESLIATRFAQGADAPSLSVKEQDGVTLASEPLDSESWRPLQSNCIVVVRDGRLISEEPIAS